MPSRKPTESALTGLGLDTRFCDGGNYIAVLECGTIPLQQWGGAALSQSLTLADGAYATLTSSTSTAPSPSAAKKWTPMILG